VIATPPPVKVKGISTKVVYTAEVIDPSEFLAWTLRKGKFDEFYSLNQKALDAKVNKAEGDIEISGVKIHSKTDVRQGGKR